jgi:hypothetical protein
MMWVTRTDVRVNRAATAWLIRRFIDPAATFCFTVPDEVARVQARDGAIGFDAPQATYPHCDDWGRCSFEALVEEHQPADAALRRLAAIVHRADFPQRLDARAKSARLEFALDVVSPFPGGSASRQQAADIAPGLRAISQGFPLVTADDHETVERSAFLYDALYAALRAGLRR